MAVNWNSGLMRWKPHVDASGKSYSLSHLHPFRFTLPVTRSNDQVMELAVYVGFAMHCFARKIEADDPKDMVYSDDREKRTFCLERYALSKDLPEIVRGLVSAKCGFAKDDNFVTINVSKERRYGVFFNAKKWESGAGEKGILLVIQSAYELSPKKDLSMKGSIRFARLLELIWDGTKPKKPR